MLEEEEEEKRKLVSDWFAGKGEYLVLDGKGEPQFSDEVRLGLQMLGSCGLRHGDETGAGKPLEAPFLKPDVISALRTSLKTKLLAHTYVVDFESIRLRLKTWTRQRPFLPTELKK